MVVRNQLFRHLLDQSAAFFARRTAGQCLSRINNDVGLVQRAVSETIGDSGARIADAARLERAAVHYDAKLALLCLTRRRWWSIVRAAFGKRVRTVDALEPGSVRNTCRTCRRGVYRPPHRQGLRR